MTDLLPPTAENIARCAAILHDGGLVAFPTDTVYGLAVSGKRADRLPALFALKQRPPEKQVPLLVTDLDQAVAAGAIADDRARAVAARWWPGPLTVVLPARDGSTLGLRAPDHAVAAALIAAAGPLWTSSANVSGQPETLGGDEVLIAFAMGQEELVAVLDGGAVPGGRPSTVLDLTGSPARILRDGPVSASELAQLVEVEA
jgi:L-threonylcarbamoyladenylate synthase